MHRITASLAVVCACALVPSASAAQQAHQAAGSASPNQTWYWCIAGNYVSSVFAAQPGENAKKGYGDFVKKTYKFNGPTQCYTAQSAGDAEVMLKQHIGSWQNAVHTGWPSGADAAPGR